jgi:hypothetical protein
MYQTCLWNVLTFALVFTNQIETEDFLTSVLLVRTGVLHFIGQMLQGNVPGVQPLLSADWTVRDFQFAIVTDVMPIYTQSDRRPHVLHTHRTLQLTQEALFNASELRLHVGCTPHIFADCEHFRFLKIRAITSFVIFRAMTHHTLKEKI